MIVAILGQFPPPTPPSLPASNCARVLRTQKWHFRWTITFQETARIQRQTERQTAREKLDDEANSVTVMD